MMKNLLINILMIVSVIISYNALFNDYVFGTLRNVLIFHIIITCIFFAIIFSTVFLVILTSMNLKKDLNKMMMFVVKTYSAEHRVTFSHSELRWIHNSIIQLRHSLNNNNNITEITHKNFIQAYFQLLQINNIFDFQYQEFSSALKSFFMKLVVMRKINYVLSLPESE